MGASPARPIPPPPASKLRGAGGASLRVCRVTGRAGGTPLRPSDQPPELGTARVGTRGPGHDQARHTRTRPRRGDRTSSREPPELRPAPLLRPGPRVAARYPRGCAYLHQHPSTQHSHPTPPLHPPTNSNPRSGGSGVEGRCPGGVAGWIGAGWRGAGVEWCTRRLCVSPVHKPEARQVGRPRPQLRWGGWSGAGVGLVGWSGGGGVARAGTGGAGWSGGVAGCWVEG